MAQNPFTYGGEVSGDSFWDREKERRELKQDITDCQKVVLYSKRRMGKTSLVKDVLSNLAESGFVKAYVDLYPTGSVENFISRFGNSE